MRSRRIVLLGLCMLLIEVAFAEKSKNAAKKPLVGVRVVQVDPTVVPKPDEIEGEHAASQVADSLRNALKYANFEVSEPTAKDDPEMSQARPVVPIRAHIVLDEFTSGSTAERFLIGFGAGRSTVDCRLVLQDAEGKELVNQRIRVRGNLAFSPYQGNNTQRRQAVSSFEQRLLEEIEKLK